VEVCGGRAVMIRENFGETFWMWFQWMRCRICSYASDVDTGFVFNIVQP
jgi:hypothetical protein